MTFDADKFVALDLETWLIEPGVLAPRIVCGSMADANEEPVTGSLLTASEAIEFARYRLTYSPSIIVGANIAYDFGCLAAADPALLPLIFKAYEEHRVFDIQIGQALHAIAEGNLYQDPVTLQPLKGRYSLARCVEFVLGREDAKVNDQWRLRYAELDGIPLDQWPEEARQYPIDDAVNTLEVAIAQVRGGGGGITPGPHRNLGDLSNQAEAAWALHLGAMWGMRTAPERVTELRARVERDHAAFVDKFKRLGFYKLDVNGDPILDHNGQAMQDGRVIKRAVIFAYGGGASACRSCVDGKLKSDISGKPINCKDCSGTGLDIGGAPMTPTGGVCADRDAKLESGDPDLVAFGDNEPEKILKTYLPALEIEAIGRSLRPNVLTASGRTSYDGLIQLLPKEGGVRECHRARPGYVYCSVDYAAGELCAWSQIKLWIFGQSVMADTINATGEPGMLHTAFGARLAGKTTEQMMVVLKQGTAAEKESGKRYRAAAKEANFALGGGMGPPKFVFAARKKNKGSTKAPDGLVYPGIRFCIMLGGAERCGEEKITEWKGRPTRLPPICRACTVIAATLREAWLAQWPEARRYFDWVSNRVGKEGRGELPCFGTDRVRGGLDYTNGCNNGFQALMADAAKHAMCRVVRECMLDRSSVLWGTRPIAFIHDELIAEIPISVAHEAGPRMAAVMVEAAREYMPDVVVKAEAALFYYWSKTAGDPVYRDGRLIPFEDKDAS